MSEYMQLPACFGLPNARSYPYHLKAHLLSSYHDAGLLVAPFAPAAPALALLPRRLKLQLPLLRPPPPLRSLQSTSSSHSSGRGPAAGGPAGSDAR